MSTTLQNFQHVFINNNANRTLFLLHGTGGNENDLLPLVKPLEAQYNFVGLKGNVSENGLARFFVRNEMGIFDQDSIARESKKMEEFIVEWCDQHSQTIQNTAFLGYSNGATMILALTFLFPKIVHQAVLLHGMLPLEPGNIDLSGKLFLVTYGEKDQLIPVVKSKEVTPTLKKIGATVTVVTHSGGHELKREEVEAAHSFLQQE